MHGLSGLYGAARTEASLRNGISAPVWALSCRLQLTPILMGRAFIKMAI